MRTFYGPVGGLRSKLPVDAHQLHAYYHGSMLCINGSGWDNLNHVNTSIRTINPANISPKYRGFSDAIRVGRYAYLCPYANDNHAYTGKLVRIYLGTKDIGYQIDSLAASSSRISTIVDVLDLAQVNTVYAGFSGIFTSGQYLYLVPYRNEHIPYNGQRGHGNLVKLDMNNFGLSGVQGLDVAATTRNQIPSFADYNLKGFSYGFACKSHLFKLIHTLMATIAGKFGILVPFFNGVFNGKSARVQLYGSTGLSEDLQELDFAVDRTHPNVYKSKSLLLNWERNNDNYRISRRICF